MTALVGKYFIGVHDGAMRSWIVEAAIDATHYIVRFDDLIGFTDGSKWPVSLAVVPISDMTQGGMDEDEPPPWAFFDDQEQRARYDKTVSISQTRSFKCMASMRPAKWSYAGSGKNFKQCHGKYV
jgi:hypothetical protein